MSGQGQAAQAAAPQAAGRRIFGGNKPPKYDEEGGFDLYKAMLRSYLTQRGCWRVVDGTETRDLNDADLQRQYDERDELARDAILRGILTKDASRICNFDYAHEMWDAFEREKTKRAFSNALVLRKKLYSYTFTTDMNMESYLDELEYMRRQLRNMNDPIADDEMVKILLQGVAFEFRGVVRMFNKDVRDGNVPALQEVLNTLRSEAELDNQRKVVVATKGKDKEPAKILQVKEQPQPGGKKRQQHQQVGGKRKFKKHRKEEPETRECFHCGKKGHLKKNCYALQAKKKKSESMAFVRWSGSRDESVGHDQTSIGMVMSVDDSTLCDEWMIDIGAGVHVCNDWTAFTSLQEDTMSFVGWQGESSRSKAVGHVNVCTKDAKSGRDVVLELEDTRYASSGIRNLLSLERLEQQGWVPSYSESATSEDRQMRLDHGDVRLLLHKRSGHYWLKVKRTTANAKMCVMTVADRQSTVMRWHMKFAHLNGQALKQLVLKDMATGFDSLKASDFDKPLKCISCQMTKQKRRSYGRHEKRSKVCYGRHEKHSNVCYERLMSDVCYVGLETTGGNRYFQLAQDEALRYKWCYLLRTKDEASVNVMNLILQLEQKHVIKKFSRDQGKEFINKSLTKFLEEHGIQLLMTNTYTPEENCLVEKLNGNLLNKVRAIRQATGLPTALWG
ncbi:hypothetical protein PC117_g23078 [Phytophthora cactorum]|uniref:CCHC-type domain-containing protein n=2 Tax=Phytophthora cactorum TaxID=29920 RepID=A0A8T1B4E5_9STRA|nr:hypothetical protein PC117_g23078 [Phytophthora cactorum]